MSTGWPYAWAMSSVAFGGSSLIVPLYVVDLGGDPVTLGVLAAVAAFAGVPGALLFGRLADRTGRRRGLLLGLLALVAAALLATPFTESIPLVVGLNGAVWFGFAAATPVVTLLAVTDVPEAAWSEAIGTLNKYQGVGWALGLLLGAAWSALAPIVLATEWVLPGFILVLAGCAVVGVGLGVRYVPPDSTTPPPPSGTRLRRALRRSERFSVRAATFPFTPGRADFRGLHPRRFSERFTPLLALYFVAVGFFFTGFSAFFAPLPVFLTETGFGSRGVFALYLLNSLAAAVCFGVVGRLASADGVTLLQAIGLSGRGVSIPLVALGGVAFGVSPSGIGLLAALFSLIGITWAVIAVTASTLVTQLSPASIRGEAFGVYAALSAFAGGIGSVLGGWLAAASYTAAFVAAGGLVLLGATIVLGVRRRLPSEPSPSMH